MNRNRITIRVGHDTLSFAVTEPAVATPGGTGTHEAVVYEPYVVKSGVSIAANLREAFKTSGLLVGNYLRARVLVDSPVLMVPLEQFEQSTVKVLYEHAYPELSQYQVLYNVLPNLNAVAAFGVHSDLKLVVDDHYRDVTFYCAMTPVWRHLHQRSFRGIRNKLFAYFHERKIDIFAFQQNRFKYCNQFKAYKANDALYYLLYVWQQLALDSTHDELHLVGELPGDGELAEKLEDYLKKVHVIDPAADFGESAVAQYKGMPYDLMTLFAKER